MNFLRSNKLFFFLITVWLLLCAAIRPMAIPDEGRYGDISRWMYESGDWLVPRLNGLPFFHKPPLLHWLSTGFIEVFGLHTWTLRLAPVMAGLVTLLSIFWFVRKHTNEALAKTSVLVMLGSLLFFGSSQYINHDLLVASWMTLTIFALADFVLTHHRPSLYIGYAACALAFLSKGLIGILLPGLVLLPWIIATGNYRKILSVLNPLAILLFAVIAIPWVVLVQQKYPEFAHYFFIDQQFSRFNSSEFNNKQPWFFYILCLIVSYMFWLITMRGKWSWQEAQSTLGRPIQGLLLWWTFAMLVFFSLPPSKLAGYILPATAPLSILLATRIEAIRQNPRVAKAQGLWSLTPLVLVGIALLVSGIYAQNIPDSTPAIILHLTYLGIMVLAGCVLLALLTICDKLNGVYLTFLVASLFGLTVTLTSTQVYHKNNINQMDFSSALTPDRTLVYDHAYFYDVPFLLDTHRPIALVGEWDQQMHDNSALELRDSLKFEPQNQQYFWTNATFSQKLKSGQPLAVFTHKNTKLDVDPAHERVFAYRNYDVHFVN